MKDLIEERNKKEKMQHSVIKWWNAHYMTLEELGMEQPKKPKPEVELVSMEQVNSGNIASALPCDAQTQPARTAEEEKIANLTSQMTDEQMQAAQAIIDRLNQEAAYDEAIKQKEIEAAKANAEMANTENIFNSTTGAKSGLYGIFGADEEHKRQIDAILSEKDEAFQSMLDDAF